MACFRTLVVRAWQVLRGCVDKEEKVNISEGRVKWCKAGWKLEY